MADEPCQTLTTTSRLPDNQNRIPAGPPRPMLLDDFAMIGKLAEQTRERVSQRAPITMESLGVLSWR
jgi:catalase